MNSNLMSREVEVGSSVKSVAEASGYKIEGKSLVVLQVNCTSIYNKILEFWNLVDTYNRDVVIGMESWLKKILAMLKSSGMILQRSEGIDLSVVRVFFMC